MFDYNLCEVLSNAARVFPRPRENAINFSKRVIKALSSDKYPDDEWDALSDEVQQWVNQQIRLTNSNKQVDEIPGFSEFAAHYLRETYKYKPPKHKEIKHEKSVMTRLREILLLEMHLTPTQLRERIVTEGYTCAMSTVTSVKHDFRQVLIFLQDQNLLTRRVVFDPRDSEKRKANET